MSTQPEASKALFTAEGTDRLPDYPALLGGRCTACGRAMFPLQTYGCENCGSEKIEACALDGRGKLIASAEVFVDAGQYRPAPFIVGSIMQDDDVSLRAVLDVPAGTKLTPGTVMVTRLVPQTRPDRGTHDLRFVPAHSSEG